ncbi:hypothetical protein JRO89_XSUnG0073400 [Xanthoceras sorbifolium]|uniref:Gag-asp_proteas domain-containing protein n=1 Tax=Xanthoceras sorbifolium TaxID=99658 RepID=A0ABQ8GZM0_9ROSI|nr:hypothetical protein JRO89_XSUnG0073400 [Xanthoceras sorbifolium]
MTLAEAKERIGQLEKIVGEPPSRYVLELSVMSVEHGEKILYFHQAVANILKDVEVRFNNVRLKQAGVVDAITEEMRAMSDEIAILRRVAMAAAEGLVDFCISSSSPSVDKKKSVDGKKGKKKEWKKRADGKKKKESESTMGNDHNKNKLKTQGCFCNGPHRARNCPKKEKINALINQDAGDSDDAGPSRVNPLQLLNTISAKKQPSYCKGLMYVTVQVNGRDVRAMLDTGVTNNFVARREADRLGLNLLGSTSQIQAMNSNAMPVHGVAETILRLGSWQENYNMMVVSLDDFDLILGIEFFVKGNVTLMPYLRVIFIGDEQNPCFIHTEKGGTQDSKKGKGAEISAKQLEKGLKRGQTTYIPSLVQIKLDVMVEVPDVVAKVIFLERLKQQVEVDVSYTKVR